MDQRLNGQPVCAENEQSVKACCLSAGLPCSGSGVESLPSLEKGAAPAPGSSGSGGAYSAQGVPRALGHYLAFTCTPTFSKSPAPALNGGLSFSRPEEHLGDHGHTYIFSGTIPIPCRFKCKLEECIKLLGFQIWSTTAQLCASIPSSVKWG